MSNYEKHFDRELGILKKIHGKDLDDLVIRDYIKVIRGILRIFATQGHSGGSAPFYAATLSRTIKDIMLFKPISPLTGDDSEWVEGVGQTTDGKEMYQNKREGAVFKDGKDGQAYFIDAIVWQGEEEHDSFAGGVEELHSRQYIKSFPFEPKTFYIDVQKVYALVPPEDTKDYYEEKRTDGADRYYKYNIKDRAQLDEVWEHYDQT